MLQFPDSEKLQYILLEENRHKNISFPPETQVTTQGKCVIVGSWQCCTCQFQMTTFSYFTDTK